MTFQEVNALFYSGDEDAIARLPADDLALYVRGRLEQEEKSYPGINADRLLLDGVRLARAGKDDLDQVVMDWLLSAPSEGRLDVVAWLLNGLWGTQYRRTPISDVLLERLVQTWQTVAPCEEAEYSIATTLVGVLNSSLSDATRASVGAALGRVLARQYKFPIFETTLKPGIRRALTGRE